MTERDSLIRVRPSTSDVPDARDGDQPIDGAHILAAPDGYDLVEFKAPIQAGAYVEARGRITRIDKS